MRPWFPMIRRLDWWRATLIGALCAYVLGYSPSTLMSMGETATQTPAAVSNHTSRRELPADPAAV